MRYWCLIFLCWANLSSVAAPQPESSPLTLTPLIDIRIRQEILDGVYYFAPDPDRDWIRVRTRAGVSAVTGPHQFKLLLTNEHRRYLHPDDVPFDWGELIIDQAWWGWTVNPTTTLSVGRENIIWDRGFLMLEGHPLDGSRSIYMNTVRLRTGLAGGQLDVAAIHNPKYDPVVLVGNDDMPLTDADETALSVRLTKGLYKWTAIWKNEVDPDHVLPHLQVLTLGGRTDRDLGDAGKFVAELALQYQKKCSSEAANPDGFAYALQVKAENELGKGWRGKAGYFQYSGADGGLFSFKTPWGRWPKWSELYIYTLIGESPPGRINVAAWENIAAPFVSATRHFGESFDFRFSTYYLLAPQSDWRARGLLTETELKINIAPGLNGHLLWEMLVPGNFHDGWNALNPLTSPVNFLRWQIAYAFF